MKWENSAERQEVAQLRGRDLEWADIARRVNNKFHNGRSSDACSALYHRMRRAGELVELAVDLQEAGPGYDELVVEWNKWLGRTVKELGKPTTGGDGSRRRVGIVGDTHCPYEARDVLAAFVAAGPYDLIVHGGDLLDWYAVSSFVKVKHVDPKLEVQHGTWVLETLSANATEVEVVSDNHSRRLLKALSKANLPDGLMELLQWFAPELDLFKLMTEGLDNVKVADPVEVVEGVHFFGQYGDLVVAHADSASKLKLRAAENLERWLREWSEPLGLAPFRVIAQSHTHQLGMAWGAGGNKLYLELGACCDLEAMQYALKGKLGYRPPVPAYTVLEQRKEGENWVTDLNSVRQVVVK